MLCNALKEFKAQTDIQVPIYLKLTSDLNLDDFKIYYLQLQKHLME